MNSSTFKKAQALNDEITLIKDALKDLKSPTEEMQKEAPPQEHKFLSMWFSEIKTFLPQEVGLDVLTYTKQKLESRLSLLKLHFSQL